LRDRKDVHLFWSSASGDVCLSHEEQGVEHDRFGESNRQDRLDENRRRRSGITPHSDGSARPDQTNPNRGAKRRQADM
jgi:hypothetical protein